MAPEKLLGTLLRSLQTSTEHQDTPRLLSIAGHLLSTLSNPLNVTLLTSQLLTSPALWDRPDGLRLCLQVLGIFQSAARLIVERESLADTPNHHTPVGLLKEEWVKASLKGADEKSPTWRHLIVIGGILSGFENQGREGLPRHTRLNVGNALTAAATLALQEVAGTKDLGSHCVVAVLNYTFPLLFNAERSTLNYDVLLPELVDAALFSREGFHGGYFLGTIDADILQSSSTKFSWSPKSSSYFQMQQLSSKPLVASMGPLSRLISHAIENVQNIQLIHQTVDALLMFSKTIQVQWRQNKLSEVDASEERIYLDEQTLKVTTPLLWQVLRTAMFATVIVLRAVLGRTFNDRTLADDTSAANLSLQSLHVLRHLHFISSRLGRNSFSQYTFVFLSSIDILANYPTAAESMIREIKPIELGVIPNHPLERCLDLFFLNTAENFSLILSPETNEEVLVNAATPYLAAGGNNNLLEIFEAAHSVILAVFTAPHNTILTSKHLPFYVDALFQTFPQNLSTRQFRLAFKTLIRITAPPSSLSRSQPLLSATLLEIIHHRALHASTTPLPEQQNAGVVEQRPVSEQSALTLTLLDALPFLDLNLLEEWLPLAAELVNSVPNDDMADVVRDRFWEVMSNGEMDVERSALCLTWWTTRNGREMILGGLQPSDQGPYMSGGLMEDSKL